MSEAVPLCDIAIEAGIPPQGAGAPALECR